jgi:hypothetical protein
MPLPRGNRLGIAANLAGHHHKAGEVVGLAAEPIGHPSPHARTTSQSGAAVHEGVGWIVVDLFGHHRPHDCQPIGQPGHLRQKIAHQRPTPAGRRKLGPRPQANQLLALQLRNGLTGRHALGHILPVEPGQLRLVIKRFQMARTTGHAEEDHRLGPGEMVQRIDRPGISLRQPASVSLKRRRHPIPGQQA